MTQCDSFCVCLSVCSSGKTSCPQGSEPQEGWRDRGCLPDSTWQQWTPLPRNQLPPLFLITSICIPYGVWVLMRSWYHIWDFFLCKSSSIRRNYGTLSLALEMYSGQIGIIKPVFNHSDSSENAQNFTLWIHVYNPYRWAFRPGLLRRCLPQLKPPLLSHNRSTSAFSLTQLLTASCRGWESPFFFFSFRCNKLSSLCSSIVCISLYFIHVLFWCIEVVWNSLFPCGKWPRCCHRTWDTDEWCYFGLSTCSLAR